MLYPDVEALLDVAVLDLGYSLQLGVILNALKGCLAGARRRDVLYLALLDVAVLDLFIKAIALLYQRR